MTDIEAGILSLFHDKKIPFLSVKEAYNLLHPTQGHGIHQVRRTLRRLDKQGILFREVREHGLHLFRRVDPAKDKWWIRRTNELSISDKGLQDFAERLFEKSIQPV